MTNTLSQPRGRSPRDSAVGSVRAFTLIELLIVAAIIAVLIALVFPAIRGTLSAARGFRCQSSQRTIAFDFSVFADDQLHGPRGNDDTDLNRGMFRVETFQDAQYGVDEFWAYGSVPTHRIPDTQGRDPMRCAEVRGPIDLRRGAACTSGGVGPAENVSFGFNIRLHWSATRAAAGLPYNVGLTSRILDGYGIVSPSAIPLLIDVDGREAAARGVTPLFTGPGVDTGVADTLLGGNRYWFPAHRHNGGVNIGYIDGHVRATRTPAAEPACEWGFEPPQP